VLRVRPRQHHPCARPGRGDPLGRPASPRRRVAAVGVLDMEHPRVVDDLREPVAAVGGETSGDLGEGRRATGTGRRHRRCRVGTDPPLGDGAAAPGGPDRSGPQTEPPLPPLPADRRGGRLRVVRQGSGGPAEGRWPPLLRLCLRARVLRLRQDPVPRRPARGRRHRTAPRPPPHRHPP
jgi:hypothetical protein